MRLIGEPMAYCQVACRRPNSDCPTRLGFPALSHDDTDTHRRVAGASQCLWLGLYPSDRLAYRQRLTGT